MYKFSIYPQKKVGNYDNKATAVVYAPSLIKAKALFEQEGYTGNYMLLNNNTGTRLAVSLIPKE